MTDSAKSRLRSGVCLSAILSLGLALSGCSAIEGYPNDPETDAGGKQDTILTQLQAQYFGQDLPTLKKAYDDAAKDTALRKQTRNDIVYGQMKVLDIEFSRLKRSLNGDANALSVGTDLTSQTLSVLGSVVVGAHAKSILSAASGGVLAANGDVNKDLYYQKTIPAVLAQMDANYTKQEALIITHLKGEDVDYPLGLAEIEIDALKDAGGVPGAISVLTQDSTTSKSSADVQKATAVALPDKLAFVHDTAGDALVNWLFPAGDATMDPGRASDLADWMNTQNDARLHGYPPGALARGNDPTLAKDRQAAADHFKLGASGAPAAAPAAAPHKKHKKAH